MKNTMLVTMALSGFAFAAQAAEVTVLGWGGAYTKSQLEAYHKPFNAATGITVKSVDADNPATPIKAQVEAGNVTIDVASVEAADAIRLCDEGLLEEIDHGILPPAADGTPATEDFLPGTLTACLITTDVYSTIIAYNTTKFEGNAPKTIADFFDTKTFPGKRGMRKTAKVNLEMALMADGVAPGDVYAMLGTDAGVDRAFAKMDQVKDSVVWWEAGAQPPQLLADEEVVISTAFNGRIFNAVMEENQPFEIIWDAQVYEWEGYVIPKGAPNLEQAKAFIAFAASAEAQAKATQWISYGPPRRSAGPLIGKFHDGKTDMVPHLPTSAVNLKKALASSFGFWADHDTELNERFNAWIAN